MMGVLEANDPDSLMKTINPTTANDIKAFDLDIKFFKIIFATVDNVLYKISHTFAYLAASAIWL